MMSLTVIIIFYIIFLGLLLFKKDKFSKRHITFSKGEYYFLITVFLLIFVSIFFLDGIIEKIYKIQWINKEIFKIISLLGNFNLIFAILIPLFFISLKLRFKTVKNLTITLIYSTGITSILSQLIKLLFSRARPYMAHDPYLFFQYAHFTNQIINIDYKSFVSGHSALFFSLVTPIICYYKKWYITLLLIFIGILVIISRLVLNMHFFSDTLGGALLGYLVGKFTAHSMKN